MSGDRGLAATRVAGRLARRELRRRPARTLLVSLLVAVPVTAMVISVVLMRTAPIDPGVSLRQTVGAADATWSPGGGSEPAKQPLVLPPGARAVTVHRAERVVRTTARQRFSATVTDLPLTDPITDGLVRIDEGRAPTTADEVLLSPAAARALGVGPGDVIDLDQPLRLRATVAGLGVETRRQTSPLLVVGPGRHLDDADARSGDATAYVDLPDIPRDALRAWARDQGAALTPEPREVGDGLMGPHDALYDVAFAWIAGTLVLSVAGIVIAAAFATSARRQLVTVGQLGANGGPPRLVRRVLAVQGLFTGVVGVGLGFALGGVLLAAGRTAFLDGFPQAHDGYRWAPLDLVPVALIALVVATVAASVPGRAVARVPVLSALAGRRPQRPVPRGVTVTGAAAFVAGCGLLAGWQVGLRVTNEIGLQVALNLVGAVGTVAVLLGMCALTPALVAGLGRTAGRLPGTWRLAARSLGRRRAHTAAMVAAVCACGALTLAVSAFVVGTRDSQRWPATPADQVRLRAWADGSSMPAAPPDDVVARAHDALPEAQVIRLTLARPADPGLQVGVLENEFHPADGESSDSYPVMFGQGVLADDAALTAYHLGEEARRALAETGALAAGREAGMVTATAGAAQPASYGPAPGRRFDVAVLPREQVDAMEALLITPQRARDLGLVTAPGPVVLQFPRPIDKGQQATAEDLYQTLNELHQARGGPFVGVDVPAEARRVRLSVAAEAGLAVGALLATLAVIAAGLALAAAETRDERDLLVVAGADPRTMARLSARKAFLVVLASVVLAVPVGLAPAYAVAVAAGIGRNPFTVPWRVLIVLVIVVPVVTALATRLASALALRVRPVRHSTMAFD